MRNEHLAKRGVNIEAYYRLNVEVGVGEFGMNEWHRLADISTSTRRYLAREEEQKMVQSASAKMAKIHFAKLRAERLNANMPNVPDLVQTTSAEISVPLAVELPGDMPNFPPVGPPSNSSRQSYESGRETLLVPGANTPSPRSSGERLHHSPHLAPAAPPSTAPPPPVMGRLSKLPASIAENKNENEHEHGESDRLMVNAPTPAQYRSASGADKIAIVSPDDRPRRYQDSMGGWQNPLPQLPQLPRIEPPPLPPKTPLPEKQQQLQSGVGRGVPASMLPYPLDEDAPPVVNMARKPNYSGR
jgi:hypothetical protein